jgi:hypothetical protein
MVEGVAVRPDEVSLGVLVSAVSRDAVDAAVAACGVGEKRSGGKLPAHVTAYLTMVMCLFADDDYEEVATKVTGSLSRWGCWDAGWSVPTASGITQARKRLGPKVLLEVFEQVASPVADTLTRGAWLRRWRLLAIDGFEVDVPDTEGNVAEFGYAGSGEHRSAFPKARVVALAECGTHAFVAAEVGAYSVGEKTLANRLYPRLRPDELLTADRNFYSFEAWDLATRSGAALLWRAPTGLGLPMVKVLPDGTYLAVLINPAIRGARHRATITETARQIAEGDAEGDGPELDPAQAHLVRVVEYDVPDRAGNGTGELIVVLSTILDPAAGSCCTERRRRSGMLKLMRRIRRVRPVLPPPSAFTGFRFPREVIMLAVRWYLVGWPEGSHPPAPTDPGVTVSRYPALVILVIRQWGAC